MKDLLFEIESESKTTPQPLAARLSPDKLDDFVGQQHILGKGKLLRRAIESDKLGSVIFFGPPGTGKSAVARIISRMTCADFIESNAVLIGVQDLRKIINLAYHRKITSGKKTILLLDEIHHFNKTQQDALLPDVEKGNITLIGITTENPFFYINPSLISRSMVFEFKPLEEQDIRHIIKRALSDRERGLGNYNVKISEEAINHIAKNSAGDARKAITAIEIGVATTPPSSNGTVDFNITVAEESIQKKVILYDKTGDQHYDHISAFIKSVRGSDPDAALYWAAKMLSAGEDPRFILRRLLIAASEDVGNADPNALVVAASALQAVEIVGMPEAKIILAQAITYVACAPKSNAAYLAISAAEKEVQTAHVRKVPAHLKDSNVDLEKLGHGAGYKYPHNFPGHFVAQEYFENPAIFYNPSDEGYEIQIKKRLELWRKIIKGQGLSKTPSP
ncbi:MAG: replication-associated recombination protein A [Elusimicrobiota bacterium]